MIKSKIQTTQVAEVRTQFLALTELPSTLAFIAEFDDHIANIAARYGLEYAVHHPYPGISIYRVAGSHSEHFRRGMVRIERAIEHSRGKTKLIV